MKSPHELRLEGLQRIYTAARREYEASFFSGDPARLVCAWEAEERAFSALVALMAQPIQPSAVSRQPDPDLSLAEGRWPMADGLVTTQRVVDDSETDKTRPLPDLAELSRGGTRPLPDLSDLESLNDLDDPVSDRTSPLDPSALEMTEHDPVGPILRAMAQSQQRADNRRQASGISQNDEDRESTDGFPSSLERTK